MHDRFFSSRPLGGDRLSLEGDEAKHLARVRRVPVGAIVQLFDGQGAFRLAKVSGIDANSVSLDPIEVVGHEQRRAPSITLATAVPKGDRFDWLVEKAAEVGVDRLMPVIWTRSVVAPSEAKLQRLRRNVIEASKQCGSNRLMMIESPNRWERFLETEAASARFLTDPRGVPAARAILETGLGHGSTQHGNETHAGKESGESTPTELIVAVGPEGGLTESERNLLTDRGWTPIGLGPTILRIETAGIVACSLFRTLLAGDQR